MLTNRITIIILTYKSQHIIDICLKYIKDYKNIIVVDNASGDNIKAHIEKNYPHIKFIGLPKNIGFGRANNIALNQVQTDYALVLNPDAEIKPESIDKVIHVMDDIPNAALGNPVVLNDKPKKLKYKILNRVLPSYKFDEEQSRELKKLANLARQSKHLNTTSIEDERVIRTDFIHGCGAFFKMSLMKNISFFDEKIFMYHEDSVLSLKVIDSGYENVVVKGCVLRHIGNGSSKITDRNVAKKLKYFKNWQLGWSSCYLLSKSVYKNNEEATRIVQARKIVNYKRKLKIRNLLGKDTQSLKAQIDGWEACFSGVDPFSKTID